MKIIISLLIVLASVAAVGAEMYKWVDENGTINFSRTPPENAVALKNKQPDRFTDPNAKDVDLQWISDKLLGEAPQPTQEIKTKNKDGSTTTTYKPRATYKTNGHVVARGTVVDISGRIEGGEPCKNLQVSAYAINAEGTLAHILANAGSIGHGIKSTTFSGTTQTYQKSSNWEFHQAYVTCGD